MALKRSKWGLKRTKRRKSTPRKVNYKNKAWQAFSVFIRKREADDMGMGNCFTCGRRYHWKQLDAGHYIPKSISLALRFNEANVHPQCTACNRFRHGNLTVYALALKKKYGETILEDLDQKRREGEGTKLHNSDYQAIYERYCEL